ncbi:NAD(+)/NADH kinase [Salinilacihabitans rarus]|uniref:NAD(+)/NADH kinase n=1 Tax=Salinilacihabitans rarus TaxID=2961596 RepID=UPI0020C84558|nr:NAD(+)/NADH kinase [Salinilacihabitans rarus]
MERAAWTAGDAPLVGVVDPARSADEPAHGEAGLANVESVVADRGGESVVGGVPEVLAADPTAIVAVGESALSALADADPDAPVLPVDAGAGLGSVPPERAATAVDAALAGEAVERRRPVLGVEASDGRDAGGRALFDVSLFTDEPARISEYAVYSRGERVAQFRADGVVVATPAGTHGYAGAANAPQVAPTVEAVAVVPVAPFVTRTRRWVLPDDDLALSVERDEGDVALAADGRVLETLAPKTRVSIAASGSLSTLALLDRE